MTIYGQFLSPENFYNSKIECLSKWNIKILQYKQNIWEGSCKYSIGQGITKNGEV